MDERNAKRVEIAKDVIKWLVVERPANLVTLNKTAYLQLGVIDEEGNFAGPDRHNPNLYIPDGDLRDTLLKTLSSGSDKVCQVCGIGAIFLAVVMKEGFYVGAEQVFCIEGFEMHDYLVSYFSRDELYAVEAAFELDLGTPWIERLATANHLNAGAFGLQVRSFFLKKNPTERIVYMMENIIKYNGELNFMAICEDAGVKL